MKKYYWVFLILIIATFMRVANIAQIPPGLYADEAVNGNNAAQALTTGDFKVFYTENNGREGLFMNIQAPFIAVFGHEAWALRIPSAVFGILTVLFIYLLTKKLFLEDPHRETLALLTAFFLAVSFWHINFSRIGFRAIMAPFFLTSSIYLALLALEKIKTNRRAVALLIGLAGLLYGLGFYSYIAYRITPLLILIIFGFYWFASKRLNLQKEFLRAAAIFSLVALLAVLPLALYFLNHPPDFFGRTTQISIFNSPTPLKDLAVNSAKTLAMFNFVGDSNARHNYDGEPELFWPVGILFIIGLALVISRSLSLEFPFLVVSGWFLITALPVVISSEGIPHALRSIIMIPPVFIMSAGGGLWLYQRLKEKWNINFLPIVGLFLLIILINAYHTYFIKWGKDVKTAEAFYRQYADIAYEINSLPPEKVKIVLVNLKGDDLKVIATPAQTIMFLTDSYSEDKRRAKNIFYVTTEDLNTLPLPQHFFMTSAY